MKIRFTIFLAALSLFASSLHVLQADDFDVAGAAAKIDELVATKLVENKIKPNLSIDDSTFLRRAYLDIVGRIPTIEETENFMGSTYERKRQQLISDLLESDGHVSHGFNFWPDISRINSGLGNGARQAEAAYQQHAREGALVLAADTTVVIRGEVLGKPRDRDEGMSMLARLSGRHQEAWRLWGCGAQGCPG